MRFQRLFVLLFSISLLTTAVNAGDGKVESLTLQGTVSDATGEPLAGVAIRIQGVSGIFYTDFEGHFEIPIPKNGKRCLSVSSLSYKEKQVVIEAPEAVAAQELRIQLEAAP